MALRNVVGSIWALDAFPWEWSSRVAVESGGPVGERPALLAYDMRASEARLGQVGRLRTCADDVAAACRSLRKIEVVGGCSAVVHSAAGLALIAKKSVAVLVGLSAEEVAKVRALLRPHTG